MALYDPDLFKGAAAFYEHDRSPYAEAAIAFVIERLGMVSSRLIDLGWGGIGRYRQYRPDAGGIGRTWPIERDIADVVDRHLGRRPPHPQRDAEPRNEPALNRSAVEIIEDTEFKSTISRDLPSIIGAVYPVSGSTQRLFGERLGDFEIELEQALRRASPGGVFHETIETGVLIAVKRSSKGASPSGPEPVGQAAGSA